MPAPQTGHELPARHGRALRDRHRLREVQAAGSGSSLQNTSPKNNIDFANTDKVMAFDVVGDAFDPAEQRDPRGAQPGQPGDGPAAERGGRARGDSTSSARTASGRSTATTWDDVVAQRLHARRWPTPATATSRSGSSRTSRAAGTTRCTSTWSTSRSSTATAGRRSPTSSGPKDVVYVGENETVRVIMRFEGTRQVHDALPQPGPRGPRHDGPVRGRRPATIRATTRSAGPPKTNSLERGRPAVAACPPAAGRRGRPRRRDPRDPARGDHPGVGRGRRARRTDRPAGEHLVGLRRPDRRDRGRAARRSRSGSPCADDRGHHRVDRRDGDEHAAVRRSAGRPASRSDPARPTRRASPIRCTPGPSATYAALTGRAESVGLLDLGCLVAEIALVVLLVSMLPEEPAAVRHERPLLPSARHCGRSGGPESSPEERRANTATSRTCAASCPGSACHPARSMCRFPHGPRHVARSARLPREKVLGSDPKLARMGSDPAYWTRPARPGQPTDTGPGTADRPASARPLPAPRPGPGTAATCGADAGRSGRPRRSA